MKYKIKLKLDLKVRRGDHPYYYSQDLESKVFEFPNNIREGERIYFEGCPNEGNIPVKGLYHVPHLNYTLLYLIYDSEHEDYSDDDFNTKIVAPYKQFLDKLTKKATKSSK